MKTIALTVGLLMFGTCLAGCNIPLEGGGEMSIGMRNDNFLVLRQTVDGDKEGKTSNAGLVIDRTVLDAFLPSPSDDEDVEAPTETAVIEPEPEP